MPMITRDAFLKAGHAKLHVSDFNKAATDIHQ